MQEADRVLGHLLDYADSHPGTLVIVIGDHETASPGFSYRIAPAVTTTLPSGLLHTSTFDLGSAAQRYASLEQQTASFTGMMGTVIGKLYLSGYQPNPAYSLDEGVAELVALVDSSTEYTLSPDQARQILTVAPGTSVIPIEDAPDGFFQDSAFSNRLSRALVDQTLLLWSSGHHTSLPVMVLAAGPDRFARGVNGYQHTTDIGRLMFAALGGD